RRELFAAAVESPAPLTRRDDAQLHVADRRALFGECLGYCVAAQHSLAKLVQKPAQAAGRILREQFERAGERAAGAHQAREGIVKKVLVAQAELHGGKFKVQSAKFKV